MVERLISLVVAVLFLRSRGSIGDWLSRKGYRWAILACALLVWQGKPLVRSLQPGPGEARDFFQEWASARNWWNGLPVYTNQEASLALYLDLHRNPDDRYFVEVNAHPPTSVLMALPLAWLEYRDAHLAWNLISLAGLGISAWLIARAFAIPYSPRLLFIAAFVLVSNPVLQQTIQGQLNCVLLLLITGIWLADRAGKPWLAGVLLGLAAAVKLLPAVLFLYFLARRQWKSLLAGAGCFVGVMLATATILGVDACRSYVQDVLPQISAWRSLHYNLSIPGWWNKLFDPGSKGYAIAPLVFWRSAARLGIALSCLGVAWGMFRAATRARSPAARDQAFGVAVTAMLLVSPVAWEHYAVVLLLPVMILSQGLPSSRKARGMLDIILIVLAIQPEYLWEACGLRHWTDMAMSPWNTLTALSFQLYAVLGLFFLGIQATRTAAALGVCRPALRLDRQEIAQAREAASGLEQDALSFGLAHQ